MKCTDCNSEIKPNKTKCSVCQYKEFQEKITSIDLRNIDYHVIKDALEFAYNKYSDGEKRKEFKEVLNYWETLAKTFDGARVS